MGISYLTNITTTSSNLITATTARKFDTVKAPTSTVSRGTNSMILTKVGNTTTLQPGCDGRQCRKEGPIIPELSEVGTRSNRKNESTTGRSEITEDYQNDTGYLWDLKTVISKNMEYELSTETTVVDSSLLSIAQSNSTNWNRSLFSNSTTNASDAMMDPHVGW